MHSQRSIQRCIRGYTLKDFKAEIKWCDIGKVIPYHNNTKKHPEEQVNKIASQIREFGFDQPITVDRYMIIITGHGRVQACKKLGLKRVPFIVRDDLSEAQIRAKRIADNKVAESEWDEDLLKVEFDLLKDADFDLGLTGFDIDVDMGDDEHAQEDDEEIPVVEPEPISKLGDVWLLGEHRVMCGDSTVIENVNKLMNGKKIDMVFTDPPYGVSYASKNEFLNSQDGGGRIQKEIKNDHMSLDETGELWAKTFEAWAKYHNDYSSYYIASPQGGELFLMMMMMNEHKHPLKHCLIWVKNNHVLGRCDYMYKHEPILYGWQHKHKFYKNGSQNKSTLEFNKPLKNDLHPTMKPVELIVNFVLNSTEEAHLVADYFLGSGTTLIACEKTNRICYGMEIDPRYVDVILKRWRLFTDGHEPILESTGQEFGELERMEEI